MAYEKRLVLFMDILGFKQITEEAVCEPEIIDRVKSAIKMMTTNFNESAHQSSRVVTHFSDSVVVSIKVDEEAGVFWLIADLAHIVLNMTLRGFLIRGGIAVGDLVHNEDVIMGPAMNEAYRLESQIALNPRVILSEEVLKLSKRYRKNGHSPEEEENYVKGFLKKDNDGHYFMDFLSMDAVMTAAGAEIEEYIPYLNTVAQLLTQNQNHTNASVREKYEWLRLEYEGIFVEFMPGPYHEFNEGMNSLPRFPVSFL